MYVMQLFIRQKNYVKNLSILVTSFLLLIFLVTDAFSLFYNKTSEYRDGSTSTILSSAPSSELNIPIDKSNFNILVIADSHLNSNAFPLIRRITKESSVSLVVHLGDHTDYGSEKEIIKAKELMDSLMTPYIVLPGDRDLAAAGGNSIFYKFFDRKDIVAFEDLNILFIDNSPNFTPLSETYLNLILKNIPFARIVFLSQPIFVNKGNIFENKYMGSLTNFEFENKEALNRQEIYHNQRNQILSEIRKSEVKLIVAGDHHRSSLFNDPVNPKIKYLINGATAEYLNSNNFKIKQENFQSQRVSIISIDKNGNFKIVEKELTGK